MFFQRLQGYVGCRTTMGERRIAIEAGIYRTRMMELAGNLLQFVVSVNSKFAIVLFDSHSWVPVDSR